VSGIWAVVPVKELMDAKQRLSSRPSLEERRARRSCSMTCSTP
jgi:2-phospho-L-lactate guanylyltransferase (CobY/MobA/RfbA family)